MTNAEEKITLSEEDKAMLTNTINKRGFFLEEKAYGILEQRQQPYSTLKKNFIPKNYNLDSKNDKTEIDLVFAQENKNLIIECKKTEFAWVFSKSLMENNKVHFIYESDNMEVKSFPEDKWKITFASEPMPMMISENGNLQTETKDKEKFVKTQTRSEDPIKRAIQQVLYQTKAWKCEPEHINKPNRPFFIPVILTNAPLLFIDYTAEQIDKNSNLIDYNSLEKVKAIIYNHPENLGWYNVKDEALIKSVFIVNINYFNDFLDWIMPLQLIDHSKKS